MKCASIFPMNAAAESPHALFVCFRREEGDAFPPPSFYLAISAEIANLIFLDLHPVVPSGPARYHPDANKTAPSQNLTQSQWPLSSPSSFNRKTNSGHHSGLVGAATALSFRRPREAGQSWGCADTARVPAMFRLPSLALEVAQSDVSLGPDSSPQHRTPSPLPSL